MGEKGSRSLANKGKAAFRDQLGFSRVWGRGEECAEDDRPTGNRIGESDVAVRALLAMRRLIRAVRGRARAGLQVLARLILLGKEHVEADRRHVGLRQSIDQ